MAQVSGGNYLRRFLREVVRQAFQFSKENVWPQVIAVATFLFQVVFRTSSSTDFHGNMLATLWAFIAALGVYIVVQIVRAPLVLDRQRADEIENIKKRLGNGVSVRFEQISFRYPTPNVRNVTMVVQLLLRTDDSPATVHDWALRTQAKPNLKSVVTNILGLGKHIAGWTIRLDAHDQAYGSIFFDFTGSQQSEEELRNTSGWILEFTDAHRTYSEAIPDSLFKLAG
jgi:hypothetical protein